MKILLFLLAATLLWSDDATGVIQSRYRSSDFELTADPSAAHWKDVKGVIAENGPTGTPAPRHRTEIRSVWTNKNIYFLFICPYEELYLKPDPTTTEETNKLWEWDVAEVFAGYDFKNIHRYKEFQVSPQSEWVDLDIDRKNPLPEGGWRWNSGFKVKARVDADAKIWYGEMQIPLSSIYPKRPAAGALLRINFYRLQGPKPDRRMIAWRPTGAPQYHVPEAFGRLRLSK